jgi:ADP-heptose:LPS heptosyltransferase
VNPVIKKILIIQTASIGDVVLATPVIEKLAVFYPDSKIDFLVKKGIAPVLYNNPHLHQILVWDKTTKKYRNLRNLLVQIRNRRYDAVINLQRFASSGLLTMFSGAPVRLGFDKNPLSLFYTKRVKHQISASINVSKHEIERNLEVLRSITDESVEYPLQLYPSQADFAKVSQYKTRKYICIAPTSLWFTKQYPPEKWVEFITDVDNDLMIFFLGAKNDSEICGRIIRDSGHKNSLNLCGKLTYLESAALMKDARMNFVNDSAPQHFASAMNAPLTTLFCSTVPSFGFGPLSSNSAVVETDEILDCRPCGLHGFNACPKKHFKCALTIKKERLMARIT